MTDQPVAIDETLAAFVAGTISRDETRARLRDALKQGQELTSRIGTVPKDRQDEVLAIFQQVARDVLGSTKTPLAAAPPSRWPPIGHMIIAALLGLSAVSGVAELLFPGQWLAARATGPHPWVAHTLTALTALAAAGAAWAVWTRWQRMFIGYSAWTVLSIAGAAYLAFVAEPAAARAMGFSGAEALHLGAAIWHVLQQAILCGLGFAYLAWQTPRTG